MTCPVFVKISVREFLINRATVPLTHFLPSPFWQKPSGRLFYIFFQRKISLSTPPPPPALALSCTRTHTSGTLPNTLSPILVKLQHPDF